MATASQQDIIHLKNEFHRIHPVFLEFTDQMKNRGKDGYGKSVGFFPLKGSIFTEFSPFEIVKLRARKSAPGSLLINFSHFLLTSQVGFHAGKPIKIVVHCFYSITQNKADGLTSTINGRVLTNQGVVSKLFQNAQQLRVRCLNQS